MQVTGVGSSFNFIYNKTTGKISTKDGSSSEFVDYFNGDISEKETKNLNLYDRSIKIYFNQMLKMCSWGMMDDSSLSSASEENEVEIDCNITGSAQTQFNVNGKLAFVANQAIQYSDEEIDTIGNYHQSYKTKGDVSYDSESNSIRIGVGSVLDAGNGYRFSVLENTVIADNGIRRGISQEEIDQMSNLGRGLSRLLHFADQQMPAAIIDSLNDGTSQLLINLLQRYGIDTSREFTINETKCEIRNGRICEVGNKGGIPSRIQNAALSRYETGMMTQLHDMWSAEA